MAQKAEKMLLKILNDWSYNGQLFPKVWILETSIKAFRISGSVSGSYLKAVFGYPYPVANSLSCWISNRQTGWWTTLYGSIKHADTFDTTITLRNFKEFKHEVGVIPVRKCILTPRCAKNRTFQTHTKQLYSKRTAVIMVLLRSESKSGSVATGVSGVNIRLLRFSTSDNIRFYITV